MPKMNCTFDNRKAANQFISSLDKKTIKARFASVSEWRPDHFALVTIDNEIVAMADCVLSHDRQGANGSILAKPGHGAHAITALLKLKRHVGVSYWVATLREPTRATVAISRRYFDEVYDQGAWEISNELVRLHGLQPHLRPLPLATTYRFLKLAGLPRLQDLDIPSRHQVLRAASPKQAIALCSPSGLEFGSPSALGMAFDLLDVSMPDRQNFARTMLLAFAAMHGHRVDNSPIRKVADPPAMGRFWMNLEKALASADPTGGMFNVRWLAGDPIEAVAHKFMAGSRAPNGVARG